MTVKLCDCHFGDKTVFSDHSMAHTPVANAAGGQWTREVAANVLRSDRWQIHLGTDGSWSISEELHRIPDGNTGLLGTP